MFTHLFISNYTLIQELDLTLGQQFCVFTGETGAGKSIILDAMMLALGQRADHNCIGSSGASAEVILSVDISHHIKAQLWLKEQGMTDTDTLCILRRVIHKTNGSRMTLNQRPFPLATLREFAALLVNLSSQSQQQALKQHPQQLKQLDLYGQTHKEAQEVGQAFRTWFKLNQTLEDLSKQCEQSQQTLDFLQYQQQELQNLDLDSTPWAIITQRHQQLHLAQETQQRLHEARLQCHTAQPLNASACLALAYKQMSGIQYPDAFVHTTLESMDRIMLDIEALAQSIEQHQHQLELDAHDLERIEQRMSDLHHMARKHRVEPDELQDVLRRINDKIAELHTWDKQHEALHLSTTAALKKYQSKADTLSAKRLKAAKAMSTKITQSIQQLNMAGGQFKVQVTVDPKQCSEQGYNQVGFLVSSHSDLPPKPLETTLSGGELSRVSLAILVLLSKKNATPTLLFDEVDAGIGGQTAEVVAQLLAQLGSDHQVMCISHLPQVACKADSHYLISKEQTSGTTRSHRQLLSEDERITEIARMLSGQSHSPQAVAHAHALLAAKTTEA